MKTSYILIGFLCLFLLKIAESRAQEPNKKAVAAPRDYSITEAEKPENARSDKKMSVTVRDTTLLKKKDKITGKEKVVYQTPRSRVVITEEK